MLETGARFSNEFYIKTSFDPEDGNCTVTVEEVVEGEPAVKTGSVTWDE